MLSGLGCASCGNTCGGARPLGDVVNYDIIKIGGKDYTTNQLLDKTVIAARDTKTYSNAKGINQVGLVKAGQPIGKVFSYIKASSPASDGRAWLMFETSYNKYIYVPDESVSGTGLKEQGTKTVDQEVKEEELRKRFQAVADAINFIAAQAMGKNVDFDLKAFSMPEQSP